jgi:DNA repair exonuclease SbcCD ATPase subunit
MRLTKLTVTGFCGIADRVEVDLDASVVVLAGRNGLGKTTICDALIWGLTGAHPRGVDPQNLYTETPAQVAVQGTSGDGQDWTISRIARARSVDVQVLVGDMPILGKAAEQWITMSLFPRLADSSELTDGLLSDSVYLQQETLRAFLSGRSDNERFVSLARMVGARGLSTFVQDFDAERKRWSKANKESESQLVNEELALTRLRSEVAYQDLQVAEASSSRVVGSWDAWLAQVRSVAAFDVSADGPSEEYVRAGVVALSQAEAGVMNNLSTLEVLAAEMAAPEDDSRVLADLEAARIAVDDAQQHLSFRDKALEAAENAAEVARLHARALQEHQSRMAELASLALGLLDDDCPVCGQAIHADQVAVRLRESLDTQPMGTAFLDSALSGLSVATKNQIEAMADLTAARLQLRAVEDLVRQERIRRETFEQMLEDLQIAVSQNSDRRSSIEERRAELRKRLDLVQSLRATAAQFTEQIELEGLRRRARSGRVQLSELERSLEDRRRELSSSMRTAEVATRLSGELKSASDELVSRRLDEIQPLLSHLYAAVDPHPTFKEVRWVTRVHYGVPRLDPVVSDDTARIEVRDPSSTLSTSQSNALAVTIFLAFSLGIAPSALDCLILDDPLQNLDDIHLLGLVDVLRRVCEHRQVIITTHDPAFARLLTRKLRPTEPSEHVLLLAIDTWGRSGPKIRTIRIHASDSPFALRAAV